MARLRLLMEKEHDSNERHITAQKGQLSLKTDECLVLESRLSALSEEYAAHRASLEQKISVLEKERSLLEAVNFELRSEKEKNYQLSRENEEMKAGILKKAHLEGAHDAALAQIQSLSQTINRLEDERAKWTGERRDLDHTIGDLTSQLKHVTAERDASQIEAASLMRQNAAQVTEHARELEAARDAALKHEQSLQSQIDERDAANARALRTIEDMEQEVLGLRTEQKRLLERETELESQAREAAKREADLNERSVELDATIAERTTERDESRAQSTDLANELARSSSLLARTKESRETIVEKLDANYSNSYTAQIFQRWKAEYRLQAQVRSVEVERGEVAHLKSAVSQLAAEKEDLLRQAVESQHRFESALIQERESLVREKVAQVAEIELAHKREREEAAERQTLVLARARVEWEDAALLAADRARDEQRERERRIKDEREKVRAELEEARRLELESIKEKEVSTSIARRPSVQSLVGHVVEAALKSSPSRRRKSTSRSPPSRYDRRSRSRETQESTERTAWSSPSTIGGSASEVGGRTKSRSRERDASRRSTLNDPLPQSHAPVPYSYAPAASAVNTNLAASVGANEPAARRRDSERRHRHHHYHHSNDASPRPHHHHHRGSSRSRSSARHRSASPPAMPPPPQPFQMPAGFAPFMQHGMDPMMQQYPSPFMSLAYMPPPPMAQMPPMVQMPEAMLAPQPTVIEVPVPTQPSPAPSMSQQSRSASPLSSVSASVSRPASSRSTSSVAASVGRPSHSRSVSRDSLASVGRGGGVISRLTATHKVPPLPLRQLTKQALEGGKASKESEKEVVSRGRMRDGNE